MGTRKTLMKPLLAVAVASCSIWAGAAQAAQPPKYLSIANVRACLGEKSSGTSTSVCIPDAKPRVCGKASWSMLLKLKGADRLPSCR